MTRSLQSFTEDFRPEVDGCRFWTPYWINSDEPPFRVGAPLLGKGTPEELRAALESRVGAEPASERPTTADGWRQLMRNAGLGIDCSGLVFYVMDQWLRQYGVRLADWLLVDRPEIADRLRRQPELAAGWDVDHLPETMSLGEACDRWHKNPAHVSNVVRLTDPRIAARIEQAGEVQPGDFLRTSHDGSDHIGVVLAVDGQTITYADSAHDPQGLGGVEVRKIRLLDPAAGLEAQAWEQKRLYHPAEPGSRDGIWRLHKLKEVAHGTN